MRLAVIPAHGGSKRIQRKNIKPFCGRPMIAWSIEAALQKGCFDAVVGSTDDPEIAREHGALTEERQDTVCGFWLRHWHENPVH